MTECFAIDWQKRKITIKHLNVRKTWYKPTIQSSYLSVAPEIQSQTYLKGSHSMDDACSKEFHTQNHYWLCRG